MTATAPTTDRFLTRADLEARGIAYSAVTLWRRARAGTFPKPVKLSESRNAWLESEITRWQQERIAAREVVAA